MANILEKILADKKLAVAEKKRQMPLELLQEHISRRPAPRDFAAALRSPGLKLIAEVKKASPSKGIIRADFDPVTLARTYEAAGAAAISVLTEEKYFQGSLEHLDAVRKTVNIPLLRKDFIYDEYQVHESAAYGADAILLIVGMLESGQLEEMMGLAKDLGLSCLVEVHNEPELMTALLAGASIIGINHRDLNTFNVNLKITRLLRLLIPEECIVVSESGIRNRDDIQQMRACRVNAVLVGEALLTAPDIPGKIKELMS